MNQGFQNQYKNKKIKKSIDINIMLLFLLIDCVGMDVECFVGNMIMSYIISGNIDDG